MLNFEWIGKQSSGASFCIFCKNKKYNVHFYQKSIKTVPGKALSGESSASDTGATNFGLGVALRDWRPRENVILLLSIGVL